MKKRVKVKNKITIDKLAQMVQRGFLHQTEIFEKKFVNKDDFRNLKNRFGNLENRFGNLENRFDDLNNQTLTGFDKVLGKLDKMDQENIVHNYKHRKIDEILEFHDARIKKLEIKK